MTLNEAKELAQQGVKMTHQYFTEDEYITMKENMIIFEDGCERLFDDFVKNKEYLLEGWSKFKG